MLAPALTLERPDAGDVPQTRGPSPARAEAAVHFDLVTARAAFDALEEDWNGLFARGGRDTQLFQSFNWLWHWANHYLPADAADNAGPKLAIVTARVADRLVLAWPMVCERVGPIAQLSWMGAPVSQYGDVLIDPDADANALLASALAFVQARSGADVLRLRKVREDAVIAPFLAQIGARILSEDTAPYLTLSGVSDAEYEKRISNGARRKRRQKRRRLEDQGAVAFVRETAGSEARTLIETTFRLKRAWLKSRGLLSAAFADPRMERFFIALASDSARPAGFHIQALTCGGQPVAIETGVICKGRCAPHISVYEPAFEKCSVGQLLWEDSIRRARADGIAIFDFMAPGDTYKLEWADSTVAVRDWAVSTSLAGRAYAAVYLGLLRTAAKHGLDRMPVGARRRIAETVGRMLGSKKE